MRLTLPLVFLPILLIGCGTFSHNYSSEHSSYQAMIESDFKENLWIPIERGKINPLVVGKARTPLDALSTYCLKDNGTIKQIAPDKDVARYHEEVRELTGLFQCLDTVTDVPLWMANIDAREHVGGLQKSGGYLFRLKYHDLAAYQQTQGITQQAAKAIKEAAKESRDLFLSVSSNSKNIGDSVCTWANAYGFVDELSGSKLKIKVMGTAANQKKGFFFKGTEVNVNARASGKYLWDESHNWAACKFSG